MANVPVMSTIEILMLVVVIVIGLLVIECMWRSRQHLHAHAADDRRDETAPDQGRAVKSLHSGA
jgi:FtsZ-interacting cell division protein ZipA